MRSASALLQPVHPAVLAMSAMLWNETRGISTRVAALMRCPCFVSRQPYSMELPPCGGHRTGSFPGTRHTWELTSATGRNRPRPSANRVGPKAHTHPVLGACTNEYWVLKLRASRPLRSSCTCRASLSSGERPSTSRAPHQPLPSRYQGARLRHPPRRRRARVTDTAQVEGLDRWLRSRPFERHSSGRERSLRWGAGCPAGHPTGPRGWTSPRLVRRSAAAPGARTRAQPAPSCLCQPLTGASLRSQAPVCSLRRPSMAAARRSMSRAWPPAPPPPPPASPPSAAAANRGLRDSPGADVTDICRRVPLCVSGDPEVVPRGSLVVGRWGGVTPGPA